MPEKQRFKMHFPLEVTDGWPPVAAETVWVKQAESTLFEVENIPFFVKLIAYHDIVEGDVDGNILSFRRLAKPSGYATVRVVYNDIEKKDQLVSQLEALGCEVEGMPQFSLIAIAVPPGKIFDPTMVIVRDGFKKRWWDYEEGCLPAKPRKGLLSWFKKT